MSQTPPLEASPQFPVTPAQPIGPIVDKASVFGANTPKWLWPTLGTVAGVGLLGGGIYAYQQSQNNTQSVSSAEPSPTPAVAEPATTTEPERAPSTATPEKPETQPAKQAKDLPQAKPSSRKAKATPKKKSQRPKAASSSRKVLRWPQFSTASFKVALQKTIKHPMTWAVIPPVIFSALGVHVYRGFSRTVQSKAAQAAMPVVKEVLTQMPGAAGIGMKGLFGAGIVGAGVYFALKNLYTEPDGFARKTVKALFNGGTNGFHQLNFHRYFDRQYKLWLEANPDSQAKRNKLLALKQMNENSVLQETQKAQTDPNPLRMASIRTAKSFAQWRDLEIRQLDATNKQSVAKDLLKKNPKHKTYYEQAIRYFGKIAKQLNNPIENTRKAALEASFKEGQVYAQNLNRNFLRLSRELKPTYKALNDLNRFNNAQERMPSNPFEFLQYINSDDAAPLKEAVKKYLRLKHPDRNQGQENELFSRLSSFPKDLRDGLFDITPERRQLEQGILNLKANLGQLPASERTRMAALFNVSLGSD